MDTNNLIDDSLISDIIAMQDKNVTINNEIVPSTEDETASDQGKYLKDSSYSLDSSLDLSSITKEQATNIAAALYKTAETSSGNNSIGSSSSSSSSTVLDAVLDTVDNITDWINEAFGFVDTTITESISKIIYNWSTFTANSTITGLVKGILKIIADGTKDYQDGVSETSFGYRMEETWEGSGTKSFLDYFSSVNAGVASESRTIKILNSTPLDSGDKRTAIYGTMMLGTPFLFNQNADPTNRSLINSFLKDGKFLSLTPGMPKYNGLSYTASDANSQLYQTETPSAMLDYLARNGLDSAFSNKDKRYYTFKTNYPEYFAYLETMLNIVWIKLGLATDGQDFNLFSFFNIKTSSTGGIDPTNYNSLLEQYRSSIGFFTNIASAVSESIDATQTSVGGELSGAVNSASETYQRINYITGMGTGGYAKNISRKIGIGINSYKQAKSIMSDTYSNTISSLKDVTSSSGTLAKLKALVSAGLNAITDTTAFMNTNDLGSVMQQFATSNGMKVVYPELWADSTYSKNMNFNFTFVSPYGDPLSIFKYVYVPFCALACFAMPRQAAENGYVSPFFIRADVPGLITSDLALLSSLTWTKGGANSLWTKDGLPRAIDCSITVTDLYPYLSMTKRASFLSANPSYAVFLDNMTGMCALNDDSNSDGLNTYFKEVINRINGLENNGIKMWNKYNSAKSAETKRISQSVRDSVSGKVDPHAIPWLHNSSAL